MERVVAFTIAKSGALEHHRTFSASSIPSKRFFRSFIRIPSLKVKDEFLTDKCGC